MSEHGQGEDEMDIAEILDGLAIWDELKPQSAGDWIAVARRSVEAPDYAPHVGSPMFRALYAVTAALMEIRDADPVDNALDPQRPARIAKHVLR